MMTASELVIAYASGARDFSDETIYGDLRLAMLPDQATEDGVSRLIGCDFSGCNISANSWCSVQVFNSSFVGAIVCGQCRGIGLMGCDLSGVDFTGACLHGCRAVDSLWTGATLRRGAEAWLNTRAVDLSYSWLAGADLSSLNFPRLWLRCTDLRTTDLTPLDPALLDLRGALRLADDPVPDGWIAYTSWQAMRDHEVALEQAKHPGAVRYPRDWVPQLPMTTPVDFAPRVKSAYAVFFEPGELRWLGRAP